MKTIANLKRAAWFCAPIFATACAPAADSDQPQTQAAAQALTVIDCQTTAAECLGMLPSSDTVAMCRDQVTQCLEQLAQQRQAQRDEFAMCRDTAVACAQNAADFAGAASCRGDFEDCISGLVTLPGLPPAPNLPTSLPGSPGNRPGGAADDDADAGTAMGGMADAGMGMSGAASGLPGGRPPNLPGSALLSDAEACRQDALDCARAASSTSDVAACAEGFRSCMTDLISSALPAAPGGGGSGAPGLPQRPQPTLPTLPALPDGGLNGPGVAGGGDCLSGFNQCLMGGGQPADCVSQARECAGL